MCHNFALRCIISLFIILLSGWSWGQTIPLLHAHSHNDYKHEHPLFDALDSGFTGIEADIFLIHKKIIVSHLRPTFKKKKTLENLYLKPLSERIHKNDETIFPSNKQPVILLIDIKTNASKTYLALKPLFEKYKDILTSFEKNKIETRAVTIILSGNKPYEDLGDSTIRYAFIDESLLGLEKNHPNTLCWMASTKYSKVLDWKGNKNIPAEEKQKLIKFISTAHQQGKIVRLWACPENEKVWKELLDCGVDLISTDKIQDLKKFLLEQKK